MTSMRRRVVAATMVLFLFGASAAALIVAKTPETPQQRAASDARAACEHVSAFERLVARNAAVADAQTELAAALTAARSAMALDPRWVPLESGLRTIQLSLEHDDAGSANVGVRVVIAACKDAA